MLIEVDSNSAEPLKNKLADIKAKHLSLIQDPFYIIQILEVFFSCIFLKWKDLSKSHAQQAAQTTQQPLTPSVRTNDIKDNLFILYGKDAAQNIDVIDEESFVMNHAQLKQVLDFLEGCTDELVKQHLEQYNHQQQQREVQSKSQQLTQQNSTTSLSSNINFRFEMIQRRLREAKWRLEMFEAMIDNNENNTNYFYRGKRFMPVLLSSATTLATISLRNNHNNQPIVQKIIDFFSNKQHEDEDVNSSVTSNLAVILQISQWFSKLLNHQTNIDSTQNQIVIEEFDKLLSNQATTEAFLLCIDSAFCAAAAAQQLAPSKVNEDASNNLSKIVFANELFEKAKNLLSQISALSHFSVGSTFNSAVSVIIRGAFQKFVNRVDVYLGLTHTNNNNNNVLQNSTNNIANNLNNNTLITPNLKTFLFNLQTQLPCSQFLKV